MPADIKAMNFRLIVFAALALTFPGVASAHSENASLKTSAFSVTVDGHEVAMPDPLDLRDQTPETTPDTQTAAPTPSPTPAPPFIYKPTPKPLETTVIGGVTYSIAGRGSSQDGKSTYTYFTNPAPADWAAFMVQGQEYWAAQGRSVDCPNGISVLTADLPPNTIAVAAVPGCKTWVSVYALDKTYSPWAKCTVMVHEYGHMTGLEHSVGGIMDGNGGIFVNRLPQCESFSNMVTGPVTSSSIPVGTDPMTIPQPKTLTGADARRNVAELLGKKWKVCGCRRVTPLKVNCRVKKGKQHVTIKVKMSLRSGDNRYYTIKAPWTTMSYLAGPVTG